MLARNLDCSPAADDIGMVASVYLDDFTAHGLTDTDTDADRLGEAFEISGRKAMRFPRPADVILFLPRKEVRAIEYKMSEGQAARNVKFIQQRLKPQLLGKAENSNHMDGAKE